ncbi:hypothetical protein DSM03_103409 [Leeuwenhoekiella aestuarii]|uniref:Uncharacterized protein n=1 Tax=Leeuwenhoekiella aestuarii TaxID=2249426 RepID=A0A4Q0NXC7_9FLAO|nr:hypothetical protein [Leeuwenhoekiella aestuarii]RXG16223.1 hypothetical protein DSM03_103409 [Leeuwenhoekiella aestuarii]RXG16916.1 hypothetical protein DSM04_102498 [Leeuwenhoekiella aestuarii]
MKLIYSFIIFLAGFVQLSGGATLPARANTAIEYNAEASLYSQQFFHFDVNHKHSPEIRMAEFEIEESSDSVSKDKQTQSLNTSILATQTSAPRCFYFKYKHLKSKARSSISAAVKPYLLFQVFRL